MIDRLRTESGSGAPVVAASSAATRMARAPAP